MRYRPEIDGLRGVAVLLVLLYHAAGLFPAGFVGVDVFFVISGYVITRTIVADLETDRYSLLGFYERRVRRIAPALVAVILASAVASAFVLLPIDLKAMGKSAIAAALMVSNMLFWQDAGYFDAAAQTKPLLHTWSLGIEEQFYLLYPLLLVGLWRRARRALLPVLGVLFVVSLAAAIWRMGDNPTDVFYLAPFRFWELLLGGLIALRPVRTLEGSGVALTGLGMVAASALFFTEATPFPGAAALLPTIGAALAINGAREGMAAARLLGSRALVFVGKISYSLYLVHWPIIVLVEYRQDARLTDLQAALVIGVSLALAWASWRFVEQPFRRKSHEPRPLAGLFGGAAAAVALCCAVGLGFIVMKGWPGRLAPDVRAIYALIPPTWKDEPRCFVDVKGRTGPTADDIRAGRLCSMSETAKSAPPKFLVWGDSHAPAMAPGIFKAGDQLGLRGLIVGAGSCAPLDGFETLMARADTRRRCNDVNAATFDFLKRERVPLVFMVGRWARAATGNQFGDEGMFFDPAKIAPPVPGEDAKFEAALDRTLARLKSYGVRPVIVLDVPEAGYAVPYALAKAKMAGRDTSFIALTRRTELSRDARATEIIRKAAAKHGVDVVEPDTFFCDDVTCSLVRDGVPLYRDADHITRDTSLKLSVVFDAVFRSFVSASN